MLAGETEIVLELRVGARWVWSWGDLVESEGEREGEAGRRAAGEVVLWEGEGSTFAAERKADGVTSLGDTPAPEEPLIHTHTHTHTHHTTLTHTHTHQTTLTHTHTHQTTHTHTHQTTLTHTHTRPHAHTHTHTHTTLYLVKVNMPTMMYTVHHKV